MKLSKSQQFFSGCLCFLVGVALGEAISWTNIWFLMIIVFALVMISFSGRFKIAIVFILLLTFGVFWNNNFQPNINEQHISFYNGKTKTFIALISDEPASDLTKQQLTVQPQEFNGKILLNMALYPQYSYGDKLSVSCKLAEPAQFINFRYDKYLARSGVYSVCEQANVQIISSDNGNPIIAGIFKIKEVVGAKINSSMSEPAASLLAGILLGSRQNIPDDLMTGFNRTGITHIIAISGFNITVIVAALMGLAKSLAINRKKATWGIVAGLIFFAILTGMSASVLRASVMGMLVVFAKHLGRPSKISNVLIFSAALLILFNPRTLIWDAGFQLSFLSTIGLIYFSPVLEKYLQWLPEKLGVRENLTCTLSAIIFTLPLILFNFQRLSIVAPIVNLLVLPVIPISMLVGFIQVIAAFVFPFLGQIVGWVTWLLLTYVVKIVETFSGFKWAAVDLSVNIWVAILLYALIGVIIVMDKYNKPKSTHLGSI